MPTGAYNPFFDPNRGGIPGILGGIMGRPTRQQAAGQAQGAALGSLAERIQKGMQPNQALVEFLSTPEGQEYFVSDPEALKNLGGFIASQSPTPQAPGTAMVGPGGNIVAQVPTERVSTMAGLADMAGFDEEQRKAFGKLAALDAASQFSGSNAANNTEGERAWDSLIAMGQATPQEKALGLSGALKVLPLTNGKGDVVGHQMINTLDGTVKTFMTNQGAQGAAGAPAQTGATSAQPDQEGLSAINQEPGSGYFGTTKGEEVPASITDEAGWVNWVKKTGGGLAGQMFTAYAGEGAKSNDTALRAIQLDAQDLRSGKRLAGDLKPIDAMLGVSVNDNDIQKAQTLLDYRTYLERKAKTFKMLRDLPGGSDASHLKAEESFNEILAALGSVPPSPALKATIAYRKAHPEGSILRAIAHPGEQIQKLEKAAEDVLGNAPAEFATEADAKKAFEAGKVKVGDRIKVGGVEGTWEAE